MQNLIDKIPLNNKINCSQLVLGSMMFAKENGPTEILDSFFSMGGNAIDIAQIYGERSIRTIGSWIKKQINRTDVVIIGKGCHPHRNVNRVTLEAMEQDLAETCEWLQSDYVDIFMLHKDDPDQPVGYIMESMNKQLDDGKCHALGVSNWSIARIQEANQYAASHGLEGILCSSPNLSLAKPQEPRWPGCLSISMDDISWYSEFKIPAISWSSQAGGFFTGRFTPEDGDPEMRRVYYNDENWERYRRAEQLGRNKGRSTNDIALAYVLNQPFPTYAIIGPNTVEELQSSVNALSLSLTDDEVRWLDLREKELVTL